MLTNSDISTEKNAQKYHCEICDYSCSKQCDYKKHLLTLKHKNVDKILTNLDKNAENCAENKKYACECGKQYAFRQGLSVHKKKCETVKKCSSKVQLVEYLIKENAYLKTLVHEISEKIPHHTN